MGFLVGEFGFERGEAEVISYECSVAYRKLPNVALKVICELTAVPWLSLTVRSVLIFGTLLLVGWYTYDG